MKLAREFGRPDWRAMLAGMSSTEYGDWKIFYRDNYFHDAQLDSHFSGLLYTISTLFFADPELTPTVSAFFLLHWILSISMGLAMRR